MGPGQGQTEQWRCSGDRTEVLALGAMGAIPQGANPEGQTLLGVFPPRVILPGPPNLGIARIC